MKRRDIIKYTTMATGAAISAPLMSVLFSGCQTDVVVPTTSELSLFSSAEFDTLKIVVDTMLPDTDSPSASAVGVHTMIDHMVGTVYDKEARDSFKSDFDVLYSHLSDKNFDKMTGDNQLFTLVDAAKNDQLKPGLQAVKQQAIVYYLSSEEIAKNYLNYLPVPGAWESCISLEEAGGKKWAI